MCVCSQKTYFFCTNKDKTDLFFSKNGKINVGCLHYSSLILSCLDCDFFTPFTSLLSHQRDRQTFFEKFLAVFNINHSRSQYQRIVSL